MARAKQIGKPKPKAKAKQTPRPKQNGTPAATPKSPDMPKSPTQPTELSMADKAKIKSWLDKQEKPFGVATIPLSRKRKRTSGLQPQTDLFEDRLSVQYEVKPRDKWECLRRYKKFTVGMESIAVGQCILVKHDDSEEVKIEVSEQWKAKVLEVRALDSEHVYIRVAWLNRPEDLVSGRKAYHGKSELIPTNEMDIIDAMACNGSFNIAHWDEQDDDSAAMAEDQFFWRQTYDFANTKTFSKLRLICTDQTPVNPDEMIIQCSNANCRKWQHVKCIAEDAVQRAAEESKKSAKGGAKPKTVTIGAKSQAQAKAQKGSFTAEVLIKDLPNGQTPAKKSEIIVTGPDGAPDAQDVRCLFCSVDID